VVFWKQIPVKEQDTQTGEIKTTIVPMLRYYNVFHIDQCEGITQSATEPEPMQTSPEAESIINDYIQRSGVELIHQISDEAYYSPSRDRVVLPMPEQFKSMEERFSTTFHELAHSTGHQSRLDRLRATARFGSESYSKEELVAEITAAALMNHTGLETKGTFRNSTAYIQNWLTALRNDKRMIVTASGAAAKAYDYITAPV
jgi:antirestriction protein ArdC